MITEQIKVESKELEDAIKTVKEILFHLEKANSLMNELAEKKITVDATLEH